MAARILCVGDLMLDVLARLPGPLAPNSDTPAPVELRHGGSAANTAAWLASLGVPVTFAGRVGADSFGREAVAALESAGVRCRVTADPAAPTGICLVLIGPDGERTMVPSAGANAALAAADLAGLPAGSDRLHLSGYALLNPGSRPAALAVLERAAELGCPVSVDAASSAPIRAAGAERFLGWLPPRTLLLANADEFAALDSGAPDELARRLRQGLTIVVKHGASGAAIVDSDGCHPVPTRPVEVLDSTGAGDAFAAGLLAASQRGESLPVAVAGGNQTAGQVLGRLGARP